MCRHRSRSSGGPEEKRSDMGCFFGSRNGFIFKEFEQRIKTCGKNGAKPGADPIDPI